MSRPVLPQERFGRRSLADLVLLRHQRDTGSPILPRGAGPPTGFLIGATFNDDLSWTRRHLDGYRTSVGELVGIHSGDYRILSGSLPRTPNSRKLLLFRALLQRSNFSELVFLHPLGMTIRNFLPFYPPFFLQSLFLSSFPPSSLSLSIGFRGTVIAAVVPHS